MALTVDEKFDYQGFTSLVSGLADSNHVRLGFGSFSGSSSQTLRLALV